MIDNLNNALQDEADYFGNIIQELQEQNKRYREALQEIVDSSVNEIAEFIAHKALGETE